VEFIRTSGILIPKKFKGEDFYHQIKSHLTRYMKDFATSVYTSKEFFIENEKGMIIPRFFPVQKYISCEIIDNTSQGEKININHNITPKNSIQEQAIEHFLKNNGILKLDPGMGKTVISIYILATLKVKTFILVHRHSLVDQWIERLLQYTDIDRSEIGILSTSNFEKVISEKKIILCTDQAFITMLRLKKKEVHDVFEKANFGFLIADEVHTSVGAPTFSICSLCVSAKRILGLSATPYRWDGNGDIIDYHLGPVFTIESREGVLDATVRVLFFDSGLLKSRQKYMYWGGRFQRSRYLMVLKKSNVFMELCRKIISQIECDRDVIFVAERLKLLDELMKMSSLESKIKFTSGIKLENVLDKQMIFTTPGKIRDGIDISHKDCLVMTSPISNIAQITGRVVREYENKKEPLIIDMVDLNIKDIKRTIFKRLEYYESNGWVVKFIHAKNRKFEVLDRNSAITLLM